ncbi:cullin [Starmerella bacillaris]|uniref:Cullin n=1 Tax=Starmerella bacillaris TaxID=1247836 RepID=A0AAV5RMR1_STABA|nr:cullin [Starmerella bacillaris]
MMASSSSSGASREQWANQQMESSWNYISHGIDRILNGDESTTKMNSELYINLYTSVHNFCVSPLFQINVNKPYGNDIAPGAELYRRLQSFLDEFLKKLLSEAPTSADDSIVEYYNDRWTRYVSSAKFLDHIFSYLNRHWVRQERDDNAKGKVVCEINTLCLLHWRTVFFNEVHANLLTALLDMIRRDRNGEVVNIDMIKNCVQSMHEIGFDAHLSKHPTLLFYTDYFEKPFLESTKQFYEAEADTVLSTYGVGEYMHRVSQRLKQEEERVVSYLLPSTLDPLMIVLESTLISDHQEVLTNQFSVLILEESQEDLHMLYTLLRKVRSGLAPIQVKLADLVQEKGEKAVKDLIEQNKTSSTTSLNSISTNNNMSVGDKQIDPKAYVDTLLSVYNKYLHIIDTCFERSPELIEALETGAGRYINDNAIARPNASSDSKTPELLAKYADSLLRKNSRSGDSQQIASSLNGVLIVLKYTEEKEVFERHYTRMLSRRLVQQTSANADRESQMVADLRELCGFEYTNKLLRMFQDVVTSGKLQAEFSAEMGTPSAESFAPLVLADGFWPLPVRKVDGFKFPGELDHVFQEFVQFYDRRHNGRRLKWLWNFAKGEMNLNMPDGKSVQLQVSGYQMAILTAFNEEDTLSLEQIKEKVSIPSELLEGSLNYILKAGIIIEAQPNVFSFNKNFQTKKARINLNLPLKEHGK